MRGLLRRLRGLLGTAASWGVTWFGAATVYFGLKTLGAAPLGMILFSAAGVGAAGFLAGAGFAVVLSVAERRKRLSELSLVRVGGWGVVGALLVGGLFALELPFSEFVPFLAGVAALGGLSSAGTVALARRSDDERLLAEARRGLVGDGGVGPILCAVAAIGLPYAAAGQPHLEVRDSIHLEQAVDAILGLPTAVSPDGSGYLVVDGQQPHVFRFDENGRLAQRYGREGEGPGEFKEAAAAIPYRSDQILVFSWLPPAAQTFHRGSAEFSERFDLSPPVGNVLVRGDRVWISGPRYASRTGLRVLTLGADHEAHLAPLPDAFREGGPLGGIFPSVSFEVWADTVIVGFEPSNSLLLLVDDGDVLDTIDVPIERRRGVPDDATSRLLEAMRSDRYANVFGVLSTLRAIHRNQDGSTTLVHYDHRPEGPPVTSEVYVSVLSPDRQRACVDARVPLGPDASPAIGFRGDELLVLEQVIEGLEAVPVLRSLRVDVSDCNWIRTH